MLLGRKKYRSLSDEQLVEKYHSTGKKKWIAVLFNRYAHLVYGSCLKYHKDVDKARDEVMNVFEKLMAELLQTEIKHFKSWLFVVTRNQCLMTIRKEAKEQHSEYAQPELIPEEINDDQQELESLLQHLEHSIEKLKPDQSLCIKLFYIKKLSYTEISEQTGLDLKAVKSHLQNGKRNLQMMMKEHE